MSSRACTPRQPPARKRGGARAGGAGFAGASPARVRGGRGREAWRAAACAACLALLLSGCKDHGAPSPAPDPDDRAAVTLLRDRLRAAGVQVSKLEALSSMREFPGCPAAGLRYRIHFGGPRAFVNVSRFGSDADAQACLDAYRDMALKGGKSAWERLRRDVAVHGEWLFLFPPEMANGVLRERVLRALEAVP